MNDEEQKEALVAELRRHLLEDCGWSDALELPTLGGGVITVSRYCGEGFGYHDCDSSEDRMDGIDHLADELLKAGWRKNG